MTRISSCSTLAALLLALSAAASADTSPRPIGFAPRSASNTATVDAHRGRIMAITYLPDRRGILTLGIDQALKTWTPALRLSDSMERQFRGDRLEVSADGKLVVGLGPDNQSLLIVDRVKKETVTTIPRTWPVQKCFALSPDGKSVAMAQNDGSAHIFQVADGSEKVVIQGARNSAGALAWSRDGKLLATVGFNRSGHVVDPATGEDIAQLEAIVVQARDLSFSPDSKTLCVADVQGSVRLFDPKTGKETLTVTQRQGGQKVIAFSPDSKLLAVGDITGALRVYDTKTGKELRVIENAHAGGIYAIAFSPDGCLLATGGGDGKLKLWGGSGGTPGKPARVGKPGYLGITGSWDDNAKGVLIATIIAGGGADKAGLQVGDVILEVGGKTFDDFEAMRAIVTSKIEGEQVELKINRGGGEQKVNVKLGPKPDEP